MAGPELNDVSSPIHYSASAPGTKADGPSSDEAIRFLELVLPDDTWHLVAIDPDRGNLQARSFEPGERADARAWIERWNGRWNIYFTPNQVRSGLKDKKPSKKHMVAAQYLYVDIDPAAGKDIASEQQKIYARLHGGMPDGVPEPTATVFTGGGYQAIWKLDTPMPLKSAADFGSYEGKNRALAEKLGGDAVHNADRLLRLPGTVNLPNKKKRDSGRQPAVAEVTACDLSAAYDAAMFQIAQSKSASTSKPRATRAEESVSPPIANGEALDARIRERNPRLKKESRERLVALAVNGDLIEAEGEKDKDNSRSAWLYDFICNAIRAGLTPGDIEAVLINPSFAIGEKIREARNPVAEARRQIERAREAVTNGAPILDPRDPMATARVIVGSERPNLTHQHDVWHDYEAGLGCFAEVENNTIDSQIYKFTEQAIIGFKDNGDPEPFKPNKPIVSNILATMKAVCHLPRGDGDMRYWKNGGEDRPPASECIAFPNGILHLPSRDFMEPTPDFFTLNAMGFDYDPDADAMPEWDKFLESLFGDDPERAPKIKLLREFIGYLISGDTDFQKIFLFVGPPRSGKGVLVRVITALLGAHNVASSNLNQLGENFGLQKLIFKLLAVFPDARIDARSNLAVAVERLLSISGEDEQSVPRKFKEDFLGRLLVRILIVSNEVPRFPESSGALAKRYIALALVRSFYGREDHDLANRLLCELPAIFNWAIKGYAELRMRGRFDLPPSAEAVIEDAEVQNEPIKAFLRDHCEVGLDKHVPKSELYTEYQSFCEANGIRWPSTLPEFARKLMAAEPSIKATRPRLNGGREHCFDGVCLIGSEGYEGPPEKADDEIPF